MNRKVVLAIAVVVAVIAIALAVVLPQLSKEDDTNARTSTLEGLEVYGNGTDLSNAHVTTPVDYPQSPPVGGDHWGAWMACGFYSDPVPNEFAVHDLEHGSVWIAYDQDALDADQLAAIADGLPASGIASPYDGLESPIVLTAWGRQLGVESWDDPRVEEFIGTFESASTAGKEADVGCGGGGAITLDQVEDVKAQLGIEEGTPS